MTFTAAGTRPVRLCGGAATARRVWAGHALEDELGCELYLAKLSSKTTQQPVIVLMAIMASIVHVAFE